VNLILLDASALDARGHARLHGDQARHVREVLGATVGQEIRIGVLDGPKGLGRIDRVDADHVELTCTLDDGAPPRPTVDLLLALPRPKVMRRLWAQLAALGVGRIVLTNAARVERNYFDTHVLSAECYRPLLVEGLQQAQDTHVPLVSIHRRFRVLIEDELDGLCPEGRRLVAHPGGDLPSIHGARAGGGQTLLAIGPEGGWDAFELGLLEAHGFTRVSMGARTLRTDTACVALLAALS
jgi:RsmE family RNA methyltransferase